MSRPRERGWAWFSRVEKEGRAGVVQAGEMAGEKPGRGCGWAERRAAGERELAEG